jgi:hypothetical protein
MFGDVDDDSSESYVESTPAVMFREAHLPRSRVEVEG